MHAVAPRQRSDSTSKSAGETTELRTYQAWKGSNIFLLQGRLIFGPDARSVLITMFLIIAPVTVFCVFVARKLKDDFSDHWGISIMVIVVVLTFIALVLLLLTSGRDPGIIPRNAYPPEPEGCDVNAEIGAGLTPQAHFPRMKEVVVNGKTVKIKYCDTCTLYRPPRCSHCSICNNCVEKFDHHCPWVGQCIGLRNYRFFFMFVFMNTLLCIYVFGFCWVYVKKIRDSEVISIWKALSETPASIVLIIYTFICVWFVGGLTVFHLYLISINQSTYENFRYRYDRRENPYNNGVIENFKEVFFSKIAPSKNKFRAKVRKELQIPALTVSGGFVSPNMGKGVGDIEMGRKPVWREEREQSFDDSIEKDDVSADISKDGPSECTEGHAAVHPRRSSWGRKSGSWDVSPDILAVAAGVGESKRLT
ncbi:Palmitoyltransferase, DHHC domain, partial [Dillenia turbinata]